MKQKKFIVLSYLFMLGLAASPSIKGRDLKLRYEAPASAWTEALPVGNGRLGAMVFGKTAEERIQLNEETLWSGGPYDPSRPGGTEALPEIRRLVFAGEYAKAHDLFGRTMMGIPYEQMKYQPLGNLHLTFPGHEEAVDYRRELDLDRAVATVAYRVDGVKFTREVFASPVDQVIVVRLEADRPGSLNFSAELQGVRNTAHSNYGTGYFRMDGLPPDGLLLAGKNTDYLGIEGRLRYRAQVKAVPEGGSVRVDYRTLHVENADAATLLIAAATSFLSFKDVGADPEKRVKGGLAKVQDKPYASILEDHLREHRRLFRRVEIDLGDGEAMERPTDERIQRIEEDGDPGLAALYYQFGRYLLISSSRPGTEPTNLQGIWNEDANPWWDSKYTININLPMNYWIAETGNLRECFDPLLKLVREVSETGRRVAMKHWGAGGWVLHQNTDLWRAAAPMDGPSWGAWPVGGAWLCTHLFDHYLFQEDEEYLRGVYPVIKGSVRFILDILVEHPRYGWLVTCPSSSPENFPAREGNGRFFDETCGLYLKARTICAGPAMDMQIIRALFDDYLQAAGILGLDGEFQEEVRAARERLAPFRIGRRGRLQEWLEDWDDIEPGHRHLSHLWGLYPGWEITPEGSPEFARAARQSLLLRGDGGVGWTLGWKTALHARLGEGNQALRMWKNLIKDHTFQNLFSRCGSALQVDGNFSGAAGITEMLLQSHGGVMRFLPALPDAWPEGSVKGFRARGGFEVDFFWEGGRWRGGVIRSMNGNRCRIQTEENIRVTCNGEEVKTDSLEGSITIFDTAAGSRYEIRE